MKCGKALLEVVKGTKNFRYDQGYFLACLYHVYLNILIF